MILAGWPVWILICGRSTQSSPNAPGPGCAARQRGALNGGTDTRLPSIVSSPTCNLATVRSPTSKDPTAALRTVNRPIAIAPTATAPPARAPNANAPAEVAAIAPAPAAPTPPPPTAPRARAPTANAPAEVAAIAPAPAAPAPIARPRERRRSDLAMVLHLRQGATGEYEHAFKMRLHCFQAVAAGIHRTVGVRSRAAQDAREPRVLFGVGDVVGFAAVHERAQAQALEYRAIGARLAFQAVEEADPALDPAKAMRVGDRRVHRAVAAHRVARDRALIASGDRGQHAIDQLLDFQHIAFIAQVARVAPGVGPRPALDHHGDQRRDRMAGDQAVQFALQTALPEGAVCV